ncbi:cache domain-containing sensor histidine kinase [Paenibacillus alba]|uniref:Histidine kinase n=1 Tax=Paenibacillus alba TaxID=1197127 RepID=A0ABU6G919_9BACL|nr:histidine kinase [Paenibacillus alba]MEC0230460.1 histidine kinase [Paenibacillus alba]
MGKLNSFKNSIFGRLFVTFILLSIIPMIAIGLVSFKVSEKLLDAQVSRSNTDTLEQINKNISVLLDQVTAIVNIYNMNNELESNLTKTYTNIYEQLLDQAKVENNMLRYSFAFDWLNFQSFLIGQNGLIYTQNYQNNIVDPVRLLSYNWKDLLEKTPDRITWLNTHKSFLKNNEDSNVFTAAKLLKTDNTNKSYGVFVLSVKEISLYNIYKGLLSKDKEIFILDEDMNIISHSNRELVGSRISGDPPITFLAKNDENYKVSTINNQKYLTLYTKVNRMNWYIVERIPMSLIYKDIDVLKSRIFYIACICILLSLIAAIFISRTFSMPLRNLSRRIQTYLLQGNVQTIKQHSPANEMNLLATEYDKMIHKLERTINELVKNQEEKRMAELQALQMQINPHFLYNTLNSIKCLVWVQKTHLIEPTINALVNLLEQTINRSHELISIQDEIENMDHYIYIQQIRTSHTITMNYHIDEQLLQYKLPKLLLQPIIENAIFHGLEPSGCEGSISVYGSHYRDGIRIEIIDNGVGMTEQEIEAICNDSGNQLNSRFSGIGVRNVDERLKLNFGREYGLAITSQPGKGTSVTLTLPIVH